MATYALCYLKVIISWTRLCYLFLKYQCPEEKSQVIWIEMFNDYVVFNTESENSNMKDYIEVDTILQT